MDYMGQAPPGDIPQRFAPGFISYPGRTEANPVFSPDGREFYFTVVDDRRWRYSDTLVTCYTTNGWTAPVDARLTVGRYDWTCCFSPDGQTLYFSSAGKDWEFDIYARDRTETGWSEARKLSDGINGFGSGQVSSMARDGTLYFHSSEGSYRNGFNDVFFANSNEGAFGRPEHPGLPINRNGEKASENYPLISPDDDYLIFYRDVATPQAGIYISFRKIDGGWTDPLKMELELSTGQTGGCSISPDGKYLFYQGEEKDIYWVALEQRIARLKARAFSSADEASLASAPAPLK